MKWRLTGRYLVSVVLIVVIVIFMNIVVVTGLYLNQFAFPHFSFQSKQNNPDLITRSFGKEVILSDSGMTITAEGKELLDRNQAWIQVLDENGQEVYGYHVPPDARTQYTPMDMVQTYKYIEKELMSTVFVGEKQGKQQRYSYLIGFKNTYLERNVLTYDIRSVVHFFKIGSLAVMGVDGFIALCIAYLFSKKLTRPLHTLIDGIKQLAHKKYGVHYEPQGVYKDVFHHVNLLSAELEASEAERKKLDRMKEEWIANITHDIKTPLASIQGYAEMMRDKDYEFTTGEMRDYAEIIEQKSHYLKDVIEDLNLSTRLKNKNITLNLKSVNLVSLVRSVIIDVLNDPRYSGRNIDFGYNEETIPVKVDDLLIRRAVSNLIYNAMVHNAEDTVIEVGVEKTADSVTMIIEDHGKGIRKEELDRIFDRYYRGTHTGEKHKGSGLGMAIAHDIVEAHGGEIRVTSELHQGTKIEIRLHSLPEVHKSDEIL